MEWPQVGAVHVGLIDGEFVANPTFAEIEMSDLDLRLAGNHDAILMVECGANKVPEDQMVAALQFGHQAIQSLIDAQLQMAAEDGKAKREYPSFKTDETLVAAVNAQFAAKIHAVLDGTHTKNGNQRSDPCHFAGCRPNACHRRRSRARARGCQRGF